MPHLVAAVALAVPSTAFATTDAATVNISVDQEIDDATEIQSWILKEVSATLGKLDVEARDEAPWLIGIAVGGTTYDYRVEFTVEREGDALSDAPNFACECTNEQLLVKIQDGISTAVDNLRAQGAEPVPVEGNPPTDKPAAIGPVGIVGIVVAAGGIATAIAGGVQLSKGERTNADPDNPESVEVKDHRPQGRALLGVGVGVAAMGVIMLAVDLGVRRKRRTTALRPLLTPGVAGLQIRGRF